jgi:hypothetical protein
VGAAVRNVKSNTFGATQRIDPTIPADRLVLREMVEERRSAHTSFPPSLVEQLLDVIDRLDGVDSTRAEAAVEDSPLERIADALEVLVERLAGSGHGVPGETP